MGSELLDENKQPISENQHVESFQISPVPSATEMGQKDVEGFTSTTGKKEPECPTEETALFHEYKLLKHQQVPCPEDINNLKACLQESLRRLEEKTKDFIKAKSKILEGRELVVSQDKVLEGMQIKIKHLHKQLKHPELIGSQERKEVDDCPSSLAQKITMVKLTQKSMTDYLKKFRFYLGKCVRLLVRHLLHCGCSCLTLLLVYKHLPDAIWTYQLLDSICHQPWTH
ncbi:uncharacterized protein LOC113964016 [Neopelma chrysocephalum]|uniref:uncharacterized protein LOC113964016 n=1 Tax=Neopelma chrysocephalum TaxID=114329 RepID=UPI000FCCF44E|nr:uncharacterized protein LOC113964016 [Neopelma chrysocephalum]